MSDAMFPRITDEAPKAPSQCLFSQDHDGPWIDTGLVAPWLRPHGYIGVAYVEELARDLLDMVPRNELQAEIDALREQVAGLKERVDKEVTDFIEATVDYQTTREGVGIS